MYDLTNKYNTPLTSDEKTLYKKWLLTLPEFRRNTYDYDLQGYFKEFGYSTDPNAMFFFDKYKKPNHPAFSNESIYHGTDGNYGGWWDEYQGKEFYVPPQVNPLGFTKYWLPTYFDKEEPYAYLAEDLMD